MLRNASRYFVLTYTVTFTLLCFMFLTLGCTPGYWDDRLSMGIGGGQDAIVSDLPFEAGYVTQCTQGTYGDYSHQYVSTAFDVDLDTPNWSDDLVFAPLGGVVYVHDDDRETGFGVHVNLDVGDGTYLVIGHMDQVFVGNGVEVAAGQMLGYEGTTGASSGDHVHFGRHVGDPTKDATKGTSVEGLQLSLTNITTGSGSTVPITSLSCDLVNGHSYESKLETALWHPNGTLVKEPSDPKVYVLQNEKKHPFPNEEVFWSHGYSFDNVALVSPTELSCYKTGKEVELAGEDLQPQIPDGTLVTEASTSDVYVISDNIAMPIADWKTYLLLGFGSRQVMTVDDGEVDRLFAQKGSCSVNAYCLDWSDVTTCGGPTGEEAVYDSNADTGFLSGDEKEDGAEDKNEKEHADTSDLTVYWQAPGSKNQDRMSLWGEYTHANGSSAGWRLWDEEVSDTSIISHLFSNTQSGDTFRYTVEFEDDGEISWSCLGPYPDGTMQGTPFVNYGGKGLKTSIVAEVNGSGCNLQVTIP
jgi:hypothetical protein